MSLRLLTALLSAATAAVVIAGAAFAAPAGLHVTASSFLPDKPFPQFVPQCNEGWTLTDAQGNKLQYAAEDMPLGGYVHIYFRNTSAQPVKITDLHIEGVPLSKGLGQSNYPTKPDQRFQTSVLLSDLPKDQIDKLVEAGTPVWWQPDPSTVPAGGVGEITMRLRRSPKMDTMKIGIDVSGAVTEVALDTRRPRPRFESIAFSNDLAVVNLYPVHPKAGAKPVKILLDEQDVTRQATILADPNLPVSPIVLKLDKPLEWMSYHVYRAVYEDGSSAAAGIRSWGRDIVYGMWSGAGDVGNTEEQARSVTQNWAARNINAIMGMYSGDNEWFFGPEGWKHLYSLGMSRMTHYIEPGEKPVFLFLQDEPDATDANQDVLPATQRLGSCGQWLVKWNDVFHRRQPEVPSLLNIDNTYKPENWYMYHQIPDIPCIDPYYQGELDLIYQRLPGKLWALTKPTYVYAASSISQSAAAPKPLHVILCSTKYANPTNPEEYPGRYPTPVEKRMEVYYALAAGAKGLSYWWYSADANCLGLNTTQPEADLLYREIGLLGAEVRTAGPVLRMSCPIDLPIAASRHLWVDTLLCGADTAAVIVVNDNVASDRVGTVYRPVEKAKVEVTLPAWLKPADVFEVSFTGTGDVTHASNGTKLALDLGTLDVSRLVIVTKNPGLRSQLQAIYDEQFAANVAAIQAASR